VFASVAGRARHLGDTSRPRSRTLTGQHRCVVADAKIQPWSPAPCAGRRVGRYVSLERIQQIAVDEAIPVAARQQAPPDARASGVVSSLESDGGVRSVSVGNIRFEGAGRQPAARRRQQLREGAPTSAAKGFVRNGDLLCTSSSPGVAMRQRRSSRRSRSPYTCDALVRKGETVLIGCVYRF
jgi:hypothetical protein